MDYPVTLEREDDGRVVARFPDFPEADAAGEYEADALNRAGEALARALALYIRDRCPIPAPSARPGLARVPVPILIEAKLYIYEAMRTGRIGRAELARQLRWHRPQVDRLLNVKHASKLAQLEAAAAVLGKRLTIGLQDIEGPQARAARKAPVASRPPR